MPSEEYTKRAGSAQFFNNSLPVLGKYVPTVGRYEEGS